MLQEEAVRGLEERRGPKGRPAEGQVEAKGAGAAGFHESSL